MNIHGFNDLGKEQGTNQHINARKRKNSNNTKFINEETNSDQNLKKRKWGNTDAYEDDNLQTTKENYEMIQKHRVLFLSGRKPPKDPHTENYWNMLQFTCCPVCKWVSFTSLCLIIYLALFIAEAAIGINKSGTFLQIQTNVMIVMGANHPQRIRNGQVWRLITATVLHVDFMHFFGNFITTIIILSRVQYTIGPLRTFLLYLIGGIGGNIFSALCHFQSIKLGASTCLYSAIGFCVGYIIINWSGLNLVGKMLKCQLICVIMFILIFAVLFTSVSEIGTGTQIDYFGHIGGFLTGLWTTCIAQTIKKSNRQKIVRIVFATLLVIQLVICFVIFFTLYSQKDVEEVSIDTPQ